MTTCHLTGQPLCDPIVADFLGNLYNKEAVIEFLLGKAGQFANDTARTLHLNQIREGGQEYAHLKRMKDVFDVIGRRPEKKKGKQETCVPTFVCPVTELACERWVLLT